jgi:putative sigma-54 modulation protein
MRQIAIKTIHTETTKDLTRYIHQKIAKLNDFIPRYARKSAHCEVRLSENKVKDRRQCTVEVTLHLPGEIIEAKETTVNMYAAVDIVEEKLKTQLRKYKTERAANNGRRGRQVRQFLGKIIRKK